MVDHRRTLGESGCGYRCYVLKLLKIALGDISWTRSPAAVAGFQVYGRRRVFRCTAINDGLLYTAATVNHWPVAAQSHGSPIPQLKIVLRVCRACKQSVPFSRGNWCLKHKPTRISSWTVNYCFRKLMINNLLFFESTRLSIWKICSHF